MQGTIAGLQKTSLTIQEVIESSKLDLTNHHICDHIYSVKYNLDQCLLLRQRCNNCSGMAQFQGITNVDIGKENLSSAPNSREAL